MGFYWPAAGLQGVQESGDVGGGHGQFSNSDRQAWRVLDPDVLDVDPGGAGRVEQARQLAGPIPDHHLNRRERALHTAVLAGDPGHAGPAALEQVDDGLRVLVGQRRGDKSEVRGHVRQDRSDGRRVRRQDLGPHAGVPGGDPGHVAQPLTHQVKRTRGLQARSHRGGHQVRGVRHQRHPAVMRHRVGFHRYGTARLDQGDDAGRPEPRRLRRRAERPGAAEEQVGAGGGRAVLLPAGQRVPGDVGRHIAAMRTRLDNRELLDAGHVGVEPGQAAGLGVRQHHRDRLRRDRQHRQVSRPGIRRQHRARTHIGRELGRREVGIRQPDLTVEDVETTRALERQADRRADQPGADDQYSH
jgi:hypothetical protein